MRYAETSDLILRYGEPELSILTDLTGAGVVDTDKCNVVLDDASALIDGYLAGRYPLPLAHVPTALVPIVGGDGSVHSSTARFWATMPAIVLSSRSRAVRTA